MARRRILVAIVPPAEIVAGTQTLRQMFGETRPQRIVPHITVVPPSNIENGTFGATRRLLRSVASASTPFELEIVGVSSFRPTTPTLHFEVGGPGLHALETFRSKVMADGLVRSDDRVYRPHITIQTQVDEQRLDSMLELCTSPSFTWAMGGRWQVNSVVLMEQYRSDDRGTYWVPIVEESLGEPIVVGRGGIELVLRRTSVMEPEFASIFGLSASRCNAEPGLMVVSAEHPRKVGQPVGLVVGSVSERSATIDHFIVKEDQRRVGIGRHILKQWCYEATTMGAQVVWARDCEGAEVLGATGFVAVGDLWVRELPR